MLLPKQIRGANITTLHQFIHLLRRRSCLISSNLFNDFVYGEEIISKIPYSNSFSILFLIALLGTTALCSFDNLEDLKFELKAFENNLFILFINYNTITNYSKQKKS